MEVSSRSRVDLPAHIPDDFEVYVGGVQQARGADYEVIGRTLVFPRPIAQEGRLGFWRWAVDVARDRGHVPQARDRRRRLRAGGRRQVETGLVPRGARRLGALARRRSRDAQELVHGVAEDVSGAERVGGRKSTAPFTSATTKPFARRQQVDADEVAADRRGRLERERAARAAAARHGSLWPPSATFVRHSPAAAMRRAAPTTRPPATTRRRSQPSGGIELLREHAVLGNQGSCAQPRERAVELVRRSGRARRRGPSCRSAASARPAAPAPATGIPVGDQPRARMRHAGAAQRCARSAACRAPRRVRTDGLSSATPPACEPLELRRSALDPVELVADVEPSERDVSGLEECGARRAGRARMPADPSARCGAGERIVRLAAPVSDDGEPHAANACGGRPAVGVDVVNAGVGSLRFGRLRGRSGATRSFGTGSSL